MKERAAGFSGPGSHFSKYPSDVYVGVLLSALVALLLVEQVYLKGLIVVAALLAGGLLLRRSLSRRRSWRAQLEQSEERWRQLVEDHPEPIYITVDARFRYINASGVRIFGAASDDELIGRSIKEFVRPEVRARVEERTKQLEGGEPTEPFEHRMVRLDGAERIVMTQSVPIMLMGESAAQTVVRDVTEQRQAEEALRQSKALLEKTQRITQTGGWRLDAATRVLSWTEETCRIHEVPPTYSPTVEDALAFCTPASREVMREAIETALTRAKGFDIEVELITAEGRRIYARSMGEVETKRGRIVALTGTIRDVTERREREERLRLLESAVENANDMIIITEADPLDPPGPRTVYVNDAFVRQTGYSREEALGRSPRFLQGEETDRAALDRIRAALTDRRAVREEMINYRKGGTPYWVEMSIVPVTDKQGIPDFFLSVQRNVTRRKERERQLVTAKEKAEELSRLKSAFLANMSHEVRTPLTSIIGFADVLSGHVEGKPLELLEMIRNSGRRLERTLMSVLDLAQLESKTMKLRPEPLDLVREVRDAVVFFRAQASTKGLDLCVEVPDAPVEMNLDQGALQRILSNLITNAVKFTNEGHVVVRVRTEANEAVIDVEDTGIGIEADQTDTIFQEFIQASQGYTRDYEGSGLGLTITQELVALLGGQITVESTKGVGSTFTVRFPLGVDDPAEDPSATDPAPKPEEETDGEKERASEPPSTFADSLSAARVLLVEDNDLTREVMQLFLVEETEFPCQLDAVPNAAEALDYAESNAYDLFLIDINLGTPTTGINVMKTLREDPRYANAPMVACTAYAMPGDREKLLNAGFDAYLGKPFQRQELLHVMHEALTRPPAS